MSTQPIPVIHHSVSEPVSTCVCPESKFFFKLVLRTNLGEYWFTNRVVNDWNRLGGHVGSTESIDALKTVG